MFPYPQYCSCKMLISKIRFMCRANDVPLPDFFPIEEEDVYMMMFDLELIEASANVNIKEMLVKRFMTSYKHSFCMF